MELASRQWWKRATAKLKDKRSVYLTQLVRGGGHRSEMEAAVVRATSHDERAIDYKNAARVFAWARASPASLAPLLRSLARRAARTRSWAVALKTLLVAHGVLLSSPAAPRLGRLPFDLSDFRDRSAAASGFSAFVRAYFEFLDRRSVAAAGESRPEELAKMQSLLELLMRVRPYADGMEGAGLVLEAMNCAIIEIFEVWGGICRGIAGFLEDVVGPGGDAEERRRVGMEGMRVVRRAAEQSRQLSAYFGVCRGLGVLNAAGIPPVEVVAEEDILEIEALLGNLGKGKEERRVRLETVVTEDWEKFEDDVVKDGNLLCSLKDEGKPGFLGLPWVATTCDQASPTFAGGNLIEMISRSMC